MKKKEDEAKLKALLTVASEESLHSQAYILEQMELDPKKTDDDDWKHSLPPFMIEKWEILSMEEKLIAYAVASTNCLPR